MGRVVLREAAMRLEDSNHYWAKTHERAVPEPIPVFQVDDPQRKASFGTKRRGKKYLIDHCERVELGVRQTMAHRSGLIRTEQRGWIFPVVALGFLRSLASPVRTFVGFSMLIVAGYGASGAKTWGWYYYVPLTAWTLAAGLGAEGLFEWLNTRALRRPLWLTPIPWRRQLP